MTAKAQIARWGNSLAVRIPRQVAEEAGLQEGDAVALAVESRGAVAIKAVSAPLTLSELVSRITPENQHREEDWGKRVGAEAW
jgi:antitoxin MazE